MTANTQTEEKFSLVDEIRSLTGYEELKIDERFGHPIGDLLDVSLNRAGRAVLFIHGVRAGKKAGEAYKATMDLTIGDVSRLFQTDDEDEDDFDPDDPDTDQGKDDSPVD